MYDYGSSTEGWKQWFSCDTEAEGLSRQAENILCLEPDPLYLYARA